MRKMIAVLALVLALGIFTSASLRTDDITVAIVSAAVGHEAQAPPPFIVNERIFVPTAPLPAENTQTTIDYQPADNFNFITAYVFLEKGVQVLAIHEGVLWAKQHDTGRLMQSVNQGGNWTFIYEFQKPIRAIHVDEAGNVFVSITNDRWASVGTGQIHRSPDGGETFSQVLALQSGGAENWNIASKGGTMFVSEYGFKGRGDNARRIYRSVDWGQTWETVFEPAPRYNFHHHKILILDDGIVYQSVGDGRNAEIMRSVDNGDSWTTAVSGLQPTSAVVLENYILWGLDGGPWYGVARYNRQTGEVTRAFTTPEPFGSSNYDMVKANGVIYAMFLSYGGGNYGHPGSIFFSKDEGATWELLGYITKEPEWGVGLYSIVADGQFAYVNMCAPIYRNGIREMGFVGTLRFELLHNAQYY